MRNDEYFSKLLGTGLPVLAILRGHEPDETVRLCERAWDLGIDAVEVTLQSPDAMPSFHAAVAAGRERGRDVGAGTVTTEEQIRAVLDAGGAFAVAPGLDAEVARAAIAADLPYLPGVATGSEIQTAVRLGLGWVKAFPAAVLTPTWFTAMKGPFPRVRFVATGLLDAHNAPAFLEAGAQAVGVGAALGDDSQLPLLAALERSPQ
jgi:2-dehydro-3-deoxyphosphogluconate aldolase/(4S)-4-hydroxy-2-oxoglutarate aldolase